MAGIPQVKLEHRVNGVWLDVSSRLLWSSSGSPLQVVSGISEDGGTLVGTAGFTLDNTDGALTPQHPSSPHYPHLVRYRPVRFSVFVAGSWRARHYGYLDSELVTFGNDVATDCRVIWSTIDHFGMAGLKTLRSVAVESTAALDPLCYWPLTEGDSVAAGDQSRYPRPSLVAQRVGEKGEIGWAGGTVLPTDAGGGLLLTPETDSGWMLSADATVDLPASWSLSVWIGPAAKDGYVCQVGTAQYSIGIWYDTSTKKLSAVETIGDEDSSVDYVLSTTTSTWSPGIETLTVTATTVKLGSSGTTGIRHNSDLMSASYVSVGGSIEEPPSRARMYSGEVKHLAIWAGAVPATVAGNILSGPSALLTMGSAIATLMSWAGITVTVTVSTSGTNRPVVLAQTEGVTATDLISSYARGSLGRIFCEGGGAVRVLSYDHVPATVTAPGGLVDSSIEWGAAFDGDITDAAMAWPDGSSYTATEAADFRSGVDLPGVLPIAIGRSVADWTVGASQSIPGFPVAVFDLATTPDADLATVGTLTPGAILAIPDLPPQLPASTQVGFVRQITETIGAIEWSAVVGIDADLRDRQFIVGDAVRGKVGAGFLAAPLGAGRGGVGSWRAGEPVDAARLNSRQYTGSMVQAGDLVVTPVPNTNTSVAITFPIAFPSTPRVVVTPNTGSPWTAVKGFSVSNISTTGFTLWFHRTDSGAFSFRWLAAVV